MLEPLGDYTQRQGLNLRDCFITILAVAHDAWQRWHFCQPSTVFFAFELDRERHHGNVARIPSSGAASGKLFTMLIAVSC
jgi:hypothetical protein